VKGDQGTPQWNHQVQQILSQESASRISLRSVGRQLGLIWRLRPDGAAGIPDRIQTEGYNASFARNESYVK
jgi:G:T-mismatch repair DNA endonuclease (very short patch repair protein)